MLEEYIEKLKPYVIELFSSDSSGHDITHLTRTMNIALYIQEKEGGDRLIIGIAAFLHDVHRIMENEINKNKDEYQFVSPKDSIPKVKEILTHVELDDVQIEKICYAIENHELYNWNGENVDDLNTLILQDADNLDAIGAVGIARSFSYGGSHNVPMYDDNVPLENNEGYVEGHIDPSSIHHFYHKLFKLGDQMNTETAKVLAKQRTDFMKLYTQEFLDEWNGKC